MPQLDLGWYVYNFILAWSFLVFFMIRCYLRKPILTSLTSSGSFESNEWEESLWVNSF